MFGYKLLNWICHTILCILAWVIVVPFVYLFPKDKRKIAVFGKDGGCFVDNAKYFYLQSQNYLEKDQNCFFITENKTTFELLKKNNLPVLYYFSLKGIYFCLSANIIVVDSFDWSKKMKFFLTMGSKKVQLWHGVGFKYIELSNNFSDKLYSNKIYILTVRKLKLFYHFFTGRQVYYDIVNTTSNFYKDNVFKDAIKACHYTVFGYSRNSFNEIENYYLNTDQFMLEKIYRWISLNKKIICVVPTFRDDGRPAINLTEDVLNKIDNWCEKNNSIFIFKFHPWEKKISNFSFENIYEYDRQADIYPIFKFTSAMITDFSSIYMDYLLLDKPIIFYLRDLDSYVKDNRSIQFDLKKMMPGYKAKSWYETLEFIKKEDIFSVQRSDLVAKVFDNQTQSFATFKLIDFFHEKKWLNK